MSKHTLARSHHGREIPVWLTVDQNTFLESQTSTLLIGGTHGDERATVPLLERFLVEYGAISASELETNHIDFIRSAENQVIKDEGKSSASAIAVIPNLNPDGYQACTRVNGLGVDLNRNFPIGWLADSEEPAGPHFLSEPESQALYEWVLAWQPKKIVSLHWALAELDADGIQSQPLVVAMHQSLSEIDQASYRWRVTVPTPQTPINAPPGSFGQWAGHSLTYSNGQRPAVITLELPYRPFPTVRPDTLPEPHLNWLNEHWKENSDAYLEYVWQGMGPMLQTACHFQYAKLECT